MNAEHYRNMMRFEQLKEEIKPKLRLALGEGIYNGGINIPELDGLEVYQRAFMTIICPEKISFKALNWARAIEELEQKQKEEWNRKRRTMPQTAVKHHDILVERLLEYYQYGHILFDEPLDPITVEEDK